MPKNLPHSIHLLPSLLLPLLPSLVLSPQTTMFSLCHKHIIRCHNLPFNPLASMSIPELVKCPSSTSFHLFVSCIPTPSVRLPPLPLPYGDLSLRSRGRKTLLASCTPSPHPSDTQYGTIAQSEDEKAQWGKELEWEIKGAGQEEVWAVTGEFLGVHKWAPNLIKTCERVEGEAQKAGCVRKCVLYPEPHTILYEKLLSMDEPLYHYSYSILEEGSTAPGFSLLRDYVGTFKLSPLPATAPGTLLRWGYVCRPVSTISEDAAYTTVFSLFQAAVDALKTRLSLADDSVTLVSKS